MSDDASFSLILESLEKQFPGRLLIGVKEVSQIFDCSVKTVHNGTHRKAKKRFPVQPTNVPGKKFKLIDCARALADM